LFEEKPVFIGRLLFKSIIKDMAKLKEVKVRILAPVAGKYLLSHNVGAIVSMEAKQADVLVENKDAEFVK
jgi:hypothetical protein